MTKMGVLLGIIMCTTLVIMGLFVWWGTRPSLPKTLYQKGLLQHYPYTPTLSSSLTLMTYNIGYAGGLDTLRGTHLKASEIQTNLDHIAQTILAHNPDVLCVQEIDLHSRRSRGIDEVAYLAKACHFPYVAIAYTWDCRYIPFPYTIRITRHFGRVLAGQAVFSKYPILSQTILRFPKPKKKSWLVNMFYLDRIAQTVCIKAPSDETFTVCNVHLEAWDKQARQEQAKEILFSLQPLTNPTVIAGDFNALNPVATTQEGFPDEPGYSYNNDATLSQFLDTQTLSSAPRIQSPEEEMAYWTFPSDAPTRRLDHIFYTHDALYLRRAYLLKDATDASDHLPLIGEFSWL